MAWAERLYWKSPAIEDESSARTRQMQKWAWPEHLTEGTGSVCVCVCLWEWGVWETGEPVEKTVKPWDEKEKRLEPWGPRVEKSML